MVGRFSLSETSYNLQSAAVTIRSALAEAIAALEQAGVEHASANAEWLMAHVLDCPRSELPLNRARILGKDQLNRWRDLVVRRAQRVPLQHLLGTAEFCGLEFEVSRAVLVPRPETELLAEAAWSVAAMKEGARVLDIGTGSGCLAVSIAVHAADSVVQAVDISRNALAVAQANAARYGVEKRITFHEVDARTGLPGECFFDVIVSNPPYIPTVEIGSLQAEVRDHDPHLALDGGVDGLEFYRSLITICLPRLRPDGRFMLEVGDDQAASVAGFIEANGGRVLEIVPDLNNIERIVVASLGNS